MFGIKYIKFEAMTYVIHYKNGKIKKEGKGLSFYYAAMSSSIVAIPIGSNDVQFIFNETTSDFQTVTVQGQVTFSIKNPKQLAEVLDFTVDANGKLRSDDYEKLKQRLINEAQTATSAFIQSMSLRQTLTSAKQIEQNIMAGLTGSHAVASLGLEIPGLNVTSVKPTPTMSKALETATREALQQEADAAVYERRNFAVEQERKIKESELNTEIAVEEKQKQITEKKMERKVLEQDNEKKIREMKVEADVSVEQKRKILIDTQSENRKKEADANKYALTAQLEPYKNIDWKILSAINSNGNSAKNDIAIAFRELAESSKNIQNLNITPDLLQNIIQ